MTEDEGAEIGEAIRDGDFEAEFDWRIGQNRYETWLARGWGE